MKLSPKIVSMDRIYDPRLHESDSKAIANEDSHENIQSELWRPPPIQLQITTDEKKVSVETKIDVDQVDLKLS